MNLCAVHSTARTLKTFAICIACDSYTLSTSGIETQIETILYHFFVTSVLCNRFSFAMSTLTAFVCLLTEHVQMCLTVSSRTDSSDGERSLVYAGDSQGRAVVGKGATAPGTQRLKLQKLHYIKMM